MRCLRYPGSRLSYLPGQSAILNAQPSLFSPSSITFYPLLSLSLSSITFPFSSTLFFLVFASLSLSLSTLSSLRSKSVRNTSIRSQTQFQSQTDGSTCQRASKNGVSGVHHWTLEAVSSTYAGAIWWHRSDPGVRAATVL